MYPKLILLIIWCLLPVISLHAQSPVIISKDIRLPHDSLTSRLLIGSLNGFLAQKEHPAKENSYALKDRLPETTILLGELQGIEQNATLKDNNFYKPYLTNMVQLNSGDIMIQLSYIGQTANIPVIHGSYRFIAKKLGGQFFFYSPLRQQTVTWKTKKTGYITCYYKDSINLTEVKNYQKTLDYYQTKLKTPTKPITLYYCDNLPEALQLVGVDYIANYNGIKSISRTVHESDTDLVINGGYVPAPRFDPHDLFHERLRLVMNPDIINRPVDEGCAYLYGGSWGYTWPEIKDRFKKWFAVNPNPDWLTLYTTVANFEAGQKPLKVAYVLNALIAQKLEKEKGMPAVMELLGCGKRELDDANYFHSLQKLTGITKADFNIKMAALAKSVY